MHSSTALHGALLAALAALLWGTAGTAQSFISPEGPDALWVGALRLIFSMAFFWPLVLFTSRKASAPAASNTAAPASPRRLAVGVILGGCTMAAYNFGFFAGVREIGIALGSAVTIGSAPIWAGIINVLWKKKAPSMRWCLGTGVAVAGGVVMAVSRAGDAELSTLGFTACLFAGFSYALYAFVAEEAVRTAGSTRASAWIFTTASLIALPVAWVNSGLPSPAISDLLVTVYLGVMVTGVAYLSFSEALKRISPATGVALTLLEPVTAFVLAALVAHEPTSVMAFVGLVGILGGLAVILREA